MLIQSIGTSDRIDVARRLDHYLKLADARPFGSVVILLGSGCTGRSRPGDPPRRGPARTVSVQISWPGWAALRHNDRSSDAPAVLRLGAPKRKGGQATLSVAMPARASYCDFGRGSSSGLM